MAATEGDTGRVWAFDATRMPWQKQFVECTEQDFQSWIRSGSTVAPIVITIRGWARG